MLTLGSYKNIALAAHSSVCYRCVLSPLGNLGSGASLFPADKVHMGLDDHLLYTYLTSPDLYSSGAIMATESADAILARVKRELDGTPYACSSLRPLTGGNCNFIFHGVLCQSLPQGSREVLIKHGEDYVASQPDFKLTTSRCVRHKPRRRPWDPKVMTVFVLTDLQKTEEDCLEVLAKLPPTSTPSCVVRTPRFFHFNPQTNTQIQEYLPSSVNIKTYALNHLSGNPSELKDRLVGIGNSVGTWLRNFHTWAAAPGQAKLQADIRFNKEMQALKNAVNYGALVSSIDTYPDILSDARDVLEQVKMMSEGEMADEHNLQIIHGDFWTGKCATLFNPPGRWQG